MEFNAATIVLLQTAWVVRGNTYTTVVGTVVVVTEICVRRRTAETGKQADGSCDKEDWCVHGVGAVVILEG